MTRVPAFGGTLDTEAPLTDENIEDQALMALTARRARATSLVKSGVISPAFGSKRSRRKELISRLKGKRKYAKPVKGGTKKKRKRMGGSLTSGRSATTLKGMTSILKHPGPGGTETHSTGTDQSVHAPATGHTTAGEKNERAMELRRSNQITNALEYGIDSAGKDYYDKYAAAWDSLPELPGERTYWVRPSKVDELTKEVERLNRRGQRYFDISEEDGLAVTTLDRTHAYTWIDGSQVNYVAVELTGQEPQVEGFDFMAKIEHLQNEDGTYTNILKTPPDFEGQVPVEYRDAGPNCDVCQRDLYRKETFLVRNQETGEIVQAGRDDLASYTGYDEADQFANFTSKYSDLVTRLEQGDGMREPGDGPPSWNAREALAVTSAITRNAGFTPVSQSSFDRRPSKEFLRETLFKGPQKIQSDPKLEYLRDFLPEEADYDKADNVIEWLDSLEDEDLANDYMWNLKVAGTNPYGVTDKTMGLVASAVNAYDREMGLRVERAKKLNADALSDWVGEVKVRQDFNDLTITRHNSFEGNYGVTHVYEFVDPDDNQLVWFSSNELGETGHYRAGDQRFEPGPDVPNDAEWVPYKPFEPGKVLSLKATVKEHKTDTYNDRNRKQTVITRGKLIE